MARIICKNFLSFRNELILYNLKINKTLGDLDKISLSLSLIYLIFHKSKYDDLIIGFKNVFIYDLTSGRKCFEIL